MFCLIFLNLRTICFRANVTIYQKRRCFAVEQTDRQTDRRFLVLSAPCILLTLFIFLLFPPNAYARSVTEAEVRTMAVNWLAENNKPMGEKMGSSIKEIIRYRGEIAGNVGYYLVLFSPNGWLIAPADDQYWPTMTFGGGQMTREQYEKSPWYVINRFDAPDKTVISGMRKAGKDDAIGQAQSRWSSLLNVRAGLRRGKKDPVDVRIAPLLRTSWEQATYYADALKLSKLVERNPGDLFYYFPYLAQFPAKKNDSFPVGCTALAIGQTMHYFMAQKYYGLQLTQRTTPITRLVCSLKTPLVAVFDETVTDFSPKWGEMPFTHYESNIVTDTVMNLPSGSETVELAIPLMIPRGINRSRLDSNAVRAKEQIHGLIRDVTSPFLRNLGFLLNNAYGMGGSSTIFVNEMDGIFRAYGFANAVNLYSSGGALPRFAAALPINTMDKIVRTNLDLQHPVVIAGVLNDPALRSFLLPYNHTVVVDGYGFEQKDTGAFYHINMGMAGAGDAWSFELKQLMTDEGFNMSPYRFDSYALLYNIFPVQPKPTSGSFTGGEIVSGRVVKDKEAFPADPIPGISVRASWNNGSSYTITSTDEKGIYAVVVPSNTEITVQVVRDGEADPAYEAQKVKTMRSERQQFNKSHTSIDQFKVGNVWGVDFEPQMSVALLPAPQGDAYATDNIAAVLDSMDIPYQTVTPAELAALNPADGIPALFVEGQAALNSAMGDTDTVIAIAQFAKKGGQVFITGKADFLINTLGAGKGISMYTPMRYGETLFGSALTVPSQPMGDVKTHLGVSDMTVYYASPRSAHSAMNMNYSFGGAIEMSAYYVMRWLDVTPWGTQWVLDGADCITSYRFPLGTSETNVQYTNYPLYTMYQSGGSNGKKLVEYQINGILSRAGLLAVDGIDGGKRLTGMPLDEANRIAEAERLAEQKEPGVDITPIKTNNTVFAKTGDSAIVGTAGNDLLVGDKNDNTYSDSEGSNVYYYRMEDGKDTIINETQPGQRNALRLHTDITSADVRVSAAGKDLLLSIGSGSITIQNWYAKDSAKIDRVELYDGTIWDILDLEKLASGQKLTARRQTINRALLPEQKTSGFDTESQGSSSGGCNAPDKAAPLLLLVILLFSARKAIKNTKA